MTDNDFLAISPLIVLAAGAVAAMLSIAVRRSHALTFAVAMAAFAASFAAIFVALPQAPRAVTMLLTIDRFTLYFFGLIFAAGAAVAMLARGELAKGSERPEEFYVLLLLATLGAAALSASSHFVSFFVGLEILSVSLYALVAYPRGSLLCIEAGVKYLVLAGVSSAMLLLGMALVYMQAGTMQLSELASRYSSAMPDALTLAGAGLILVGVGFKLALAPMHLWTADVYQGSPAPVSALVATVSKGAVFALLIRYAAATGAVSAGPVRWALATLAVASMFTGNLLALREQRVKRLLAFSSISHMGYLLVALLAGGSMASEACAFYLAAYFASMLGAFGVVTALSHADREADDLEDFRSLAWRRRWLAAVMTAMMLSLAGIPLTGGFLGKFYVMAAGAAGGLWWLIAILVLNSAIGLFYYLRVLVAMYRPAAAYEPGAVEDAGIRGAGVPFAVGASLAAATLAVIYLGMFPQAFLTLTRAAMSACSLP
jgi:NADH-quinone oxidoreductase subunit N